jgi:phosphoribosylanthranilate isomerase
MKIKANHITNLTDARYFAAKDVEWLSFNFTEEATSYIDPKKAKAMFEWVEGPKIVGEFESFTPDEINNLVDWLGIYTVQVGVFTSLEDIFKINTPSVIKSFVIEEFTNPDVLIKELEKYASHVEAFELNFTKNKIPFENLFNPTSMMLFDDLKILSQKFNIILNIDFQQDSLSEIFNLNPYGLTLKGGDEERVGVKLYDELDEIFEFLENINL